MKLNFKSKLCLIVALTSASASIPTATFAWDSREDVNITDTHKTISVQALQMVKNDMPNDSNINKNLELLESNMSQFRKGTIAPDFGDVGTDRDYYLYQDHFYDPDTNKNFTGSSLYPLYEVPDTAESQLRNYFGQAVAAWKDGNYPSSAYLLGKAMHYFEDINQPHHALNWTGGPGTAHTNFETYIETKKDDFKITTMGNDKSEYNIYSDKAINDFLTLQIDKYARKAKTLAPLVTMQNSYDDWYKAGKEGVQNAQKGGATILYRFLKEVTYSSQKPLTSPIGKFHVIISTANEKDAGTDDYVYFGMEFKDGKKAEFKCDLPGNDFAVGTTGSYQCEIKDTSFDPNQIKKVYLRKQKFMGDDWKVKNIEVYMQGQRILKQDINQWLSGNTSYSIDVNTNK